MNKITDELLRRRRTALYAAKRKRWWLRGRSPVKGGGGGGLTVTASKALAQSSPTNASPINFTITFSQAVTGFTASDLTTTGSTVGGTLTPVISGTGPTYNVAVSGMTGQGQVRLSVLPGIVLDSATGLITNTASNVAVVLYDAVAPTVTLAKHVSQPDPGTTLPIIFTALFSETVTGFTPSDISFTGSTVTGTLAATLVGLGPSYDIQVTGATSSGNISVAIPASAVQDLAGNNSTASGTVTCAYVVDTTRPSVTIDKAAGQADPTSVSPILYTIVFNEPVINFIDSDITLTGPGPVSGVLSGSGPTYTFTVTGMNADGNVTASIAANVCTDLAGNLNFASTSTDNVVAWVQPVVVNQAQTYFYIAGQY